MPVERGGRGRPAKPQVVGHLAQDVAQAGRGAPVGAREGQPVGHAGRVVGVLAQHEHPHRVGGALGQRPVAPLRRRQHRLGDLRVDLPGQARRAGRAGSVG